jgi:hypothetical protein
MQMKITLESACIDTREGFSIQVKRSSGQWQKYPGQLFETNVESRGTCVTTSAIQSGKIPTMDVARPFPRSDGYRHIAVLSGTPYCNHLVGVSASTLINNFGQITCHELRGVYQRNLLGDCRSVACPVDHAFDAVRGGFLELLLLVRDNRHPFENCVLGIVTEFGPRIKTEWHRIQVQMERFNHINVFFVYVTSLMPPKIAPP